MIFETTRTALRPPDDLLNEFGYTCMGAAIAIADIFPVDTEHKHLIDGIWKRQYEFWAMRIFEALKSGALRAREPSNGAVYKPETCRSFYERISVNDINKWLDEVCDVPYRLSFSADAGDGTPKSKPQTANWIVVARRIGEEWLKQQRANGATPGVIAVSKYVEGELTNREITGARGKYLDWETIKREAMKGVTGRKATGRK